MGRDWPPLLRIAFRFCVAFLAFTTPYLAVGHFETLVSPFAPFVVPIAEWIQNGPVGLWTAYEWTERQLFGDGITYASLAGFRAYLITALAVAGAGALIWTVLDRRRREYRRAYAWLRVYLRYFLAAVMLTYGLAKLILVQFPTPSLIQLITPLGEFTRMRLLWLSMGAAPAYQIFTGASEVTGALLLFSRRTTTMGALILAASLVNVLALNLAYGIGVQLNSSVYLLMTVVLLAPEARRLMDAVFQPPAASEEKSARPGAWSGIARTTAVVKWLVVIWMIGVYARLVWVERDARPLPALYGIYDVEEFLRGGVALAREDVARWQRFVVAERETAAIQSTAGSVQRYRFVDDPAKHTLTLALPDDTGAPVTLHYTQEADGHLVVDGTFGSDAVRARLRATNLTQFTLRQPLR